MSGPKNNCINSYQYSIPSVVGVESTKYESIRPRYFWAYDDYIIQTMWATDRNETLQPYYDKRADRIHCADSAEKPS